MWKSAFEIINKILSHFTPKENLKRLRLKKEELVTERNVLFVKTNLSPQEKIRLVHIDDELRRLCKVLESKAEASD